MGVLYYQQTKRWSSNLYDRNGFLVHGVLMDNRGLFRVIPTMAGRLRYTVTVKTGLAVHVDKGDFSLTCVYRESCCNMMLR